MYVHRGHFRFFQFSSFQIFGSCLRFSHFRAFGFSPIDPIVLFIIISLPVFEFSHFRVVPTPITGTKRHVNPNHSVKTSTWWSRGFQIFCGMAMWYASNIIKRTVDSVDMNSLAVMENCKLWTFSLKRISRILWGHRGCHLLPTLWTQWDWTLAAGASTYQHRNCYGLKHVGAQTWQGPGDKWWMVQILKDWKDSCSFVLFRSPCSVDQF